MFLNLSDFLLKINKYFLIMDNLQIEKYFLNIVEKDKNMSYGIGAIKTLLMVLEKTTCKFNFLSEFSKIIKIFHHFKF